MTLKLIILAIIFVLTSGAFFTDYFKKNMPLTILAAIMAIISTLFLLQDMMSSIKSDVITDLKSNDTQNHSQEKSLQVQVEQEQQEKAALKAELEALKKLEQERQEKAALKAELEALKKPEQEQQEKAALKAELETLKKKNEFTPGTVFRDHLADGSSGPEMLVIPAGTFRMGGIQDGSWDNEQLVHEVSVGQFAMGKYEVTFAEYDKFAEATGRSKPNDEGWGRGNRPVINVTWYDATAYTEWLSNQTGKQYRLPTEAEWEYAARAGTETDYWWGNDIGTNKANCSSNYCGDSFEYTSDVGSLAANKFGLYDTSGNVWEWTCSEYDSKYTGKEKACVNKIHKKNTVLRGGSWYDNPWSLRTTFRNQDTPDISAHNRGFRVVVLPAARTK